AAVKRVPRVCERVPHVEAKAARKVFSKKRARLWLIRFESVVERLGLLKRVEQIDKALIAYKRQTGRTNRRHRRARVKNFRMRWRRLVACTLGENDRLVHRAIHIYLCQASVVWTQR